MKRLFLILALCAPAWGQTSLQVTSGTPYIALPATAPYTTLGAAAQPLRWEFRLHGFGANLPSGLAFVGHTLYAYSTYLEVTVGSTPDATTAMYVNLNGCCAGRTDVSIRIQRDVVNGLMTAEACDTETGSNCITATNAITGHNNDSLAGLDFVLPAGESIAYLRWFSTVVPVGTAILPSGTGDLGDWEFENNLNDGSSNHLNIGLNGATISYGATPTYAPVCSAGTSQTVRAGQTMNLNGTGSYGFGTGLTYAWSKTSGPTVSITGATTATPSIAATPAGSYTFSLTVTDTGGSSTCAVNSGSVTTDNNGVVITGNSTVDTLLGPMIRYGANPWPWFDDRHKAGADLVTASLGTTLNASRNYAAFWLTTQGPGTITVTSGSATVTGVGTTFTTTFCGSTPGAYNLLVWYPDSSVEGYGLRGMVVDHCTSDTQLTLTNTWQADVADCHTGGCRYSSDYQVGVDSTGGVIWGYPGGEGSNYYDAVAGLYALYYRSGLIDYLTAARTLANRFWKYRLDSGTSCNIGPGPGWCYSANSDPPRTQALLGMILRVTDPGDPRPDMWAGLEAMFPRYQSLLVGPPLNTWNYADNLTWIDIREAAYSMMMTSYCAMFDPTLATRQGCQTTLSSAMNRIWNITQHSDGSWQQLYNEDYNAGAPCLASYSCNGGTATVALTHGSTTVTANGVASWAAGQFPNHMVFLPTSGAPVNYEAQESGYYTATYADATHLTISPAYAGTTGDHGWILGFYAAQESPLPPIYVTGWGTQPFIQGILGIAFDFTAKALAVSDPTNAALAHRYTVDIANWQRNVGYRPAVKGMQYIAGSAECLPPISEAATWCSGGYGESQARTLSAESLRSVMVAYAYNGDLSLLAFGDTLYNGMYAKTGYCSAGSPICVPDGQYLTDLNSGIGWYVTGDPVNNKWHKYFGMFFGIGAGADWPAYRIGGPPRPVFGRGTVTGRGVVR